VTTAGTRVALTTDNSRISSIVIQAEHSNTGDIAVGDNAVVASEATRNGVALEPGDSVTVQISQSSGIYIDSTVNGDGVTFATSIAGV
jgi:hypothetical protein